MGSNHNHSQTIWPAWSCCYTITHSDGYESDFMFMLWEYNLLLICSKWPLNPTCLVGLTSLQFQTTLRLPTLSSPPQPPHLIVKHQKSAFLDAKRTPNMFLNMLRREETFFYHWCTQHLGAQAKLLGLLKLQRALGFWSIARHLLIWRFFHVDW